MCAQPPTSAAARSATTTAVASTCVLPRPEGAATCATIRRSRRARARRSWCRRCRCRASRGHLTTAAGPAGRAPRRASRRRSRCRRRRAASRTRRARRRGPPRAAARPRSGAGCAGADGPAHDRDPRARRHRGLGHRRAEGRRAPRDAADGEVGGAVDLHDGDRARGGEPGRAPASLTRKARATVSSGRVADVTSVRMPGSRHPLVPSPPRGHAPARRPRPPGARAAARRARRRRRRRAPRRRSPAVVPEPRQSRSTPATRARTAASGMPVSALAPAMSRASLTTTPSKPSSSRSTPITVRENVAGRCGSRAETTMCDVMTAATPASTAARKGASSRSCSTSSGHVDAGQAVVRVDHGVAVAGEVLGAGRDAGGLQALDPGGGVARDERRVVAEAAHADDRVVGGGVDVDVGREVEPDAQRGQLVPDAGRDRAGRRRVVEPAEHGVADGGRARPGSAAG